MTKSPGVAETMDREIIDGAVSWTAYQFRGRDAGKVKAECASRAEAEATGASILADRPDRPVLIYAIDAAGRQAVAGKLG